MSIPRQFRVFRNLVWGTNRSNRGFAEYLNPDRGQLPYSLRHGCAKTPTMPLGLKFAFGLDPSNFPILSWQRIILNPFLTQISVGTIRADI